MEAQPQVRMTQVVSEKLEQIIHNEYEIFQRVCSEWKFNVKTSRESNSIVQDLSRAKLAERKRKGNKRKF